MVPTRARRLAGKGAASMALVVALAGCGDAPPPALAPAATFTTAEVEVCTELKRTADLSFAVIFDGQDDPPTPENVAQLREDLADYAEEVRDAAARTTDPALRPVLDTALATAEEVAWVSSMEELRGTPFKSVGIQVRKVCGELLARAAAAEPEPQPPPTEQVGPECDLPVVFDIPQGWWTAAEPDGRTFDDGAVGTFSKVCEIAATERAGSRGTVSVATAPASAGDPLSALVDYLAAADESDVYDEVRRPTFTTRRAAAGLAASEAAFQAERAGETVLVRVCVVAVPDGLVALRFNAYFDEDGAAVEEGYELALQTLRLR
ncbi:lipoprotein [Pseudonocardia lacus]|uniref:lipoprotein n=1 Tax=Pseudonocardia lacus TaxID=2835865 RepID=UPI001BDC2393|nr:lipoprotein [Pseudonocardia lacus]